MQNVADYTQKSSLFLLRHLALKHLHSLHIEISGACNHIFFIRVLVRQRKCNQMAAIIEINVLNQLRVFHGMPAAGLDHTNGSALFGGHQCRAQIRHRHATPSQPIQLAVLFKFRLSGNSVPPKERLMRQFNKRFIVISRYFPLFKIPLIALCPLNGAFGGKEKEKADQQNGEDNKREISLAGGWSCSSAG